MKASESDSTTTPTARATAETLPDHRSCACETIALTPGRRRVLDILHRVRRPLGAYELIDELAATTAKRPAPISVYRALDFLLDNGLVHRLASRNAFLACEHGHDSREPVAFLICESCGAVSEATSEELRSSLDALAAAEQFAARAKVIEIAGLCRLCRKAGGA